MSTKINYASNLALHPLIAEHPHYKALIKNSKKYEFVENDSSAPLTGIPTFYTPLGINHFVVIEDHATLFYPHVHNGSNSDIDYGTFIFARYLRCFLQPNFKGIITHMKQTVSTLHNMFDGM